MLLLQDLREIISFILDDCSVQMNVRRSQELRCSLAPKETKEGNDSIPLGSLASCDVEGESLDPNLNQAHSISLY